VTCRKLAGRPYTASDPPPLVKARVQQSMPFEVTGIDFTGTLFVRGEPKCKVYNICLLTCADNHAVHLEIVTDLTVECFYKLSGASEVENLYPTSSFLTMGQPFSLLLMS